MTTPPPTPDLPPAMKAFLRNGLLLYPATVIALILGTDLPLLDSLFLSALLELLPVLAVAQTPLVGQGEIDRPAAYLGSSAAILILGWIALLLGSAGVGIEAMGLDAIRLDSLLFWTGIALAGGLGVVGITWILERTLGWEESPLLRQILPRTQKEKALFVGVSFVAGFGEELAYRAYAVPVLGLLVHSPWAAAALTSGTFGFLHAYQGALGIVRTALMGGVLATVFVLSGSAWPVIVSHVAIDLIGGLVLGPRLLKDE